MSKIIILTWLPHGQKNSGNQKMSGKTKKNDKSQVKTGVFEKKSESFFLKTLYFVSLDLQNSLYLKAFDR